MRTSAPAAGLKNNQNQLMRSRAALLRFKFEDFVWENKAVQCTNGEAMQTSRRRQFNYENTVDRSPKHGKPRTWNTLYIMTRHTQRTQFTVLSSKFAIALKTHHSITSSHHLCREYTHDISIYKLLTLFTFPTI